MSIKKSTLAMRTKKATSARKRTASNNSKVEMVYGAIFGRWDPEKNEQVPGLREKVDAIYALGRTIAFWLKVVGSVVVPAGAVVLARALGAPTEQFGPTINNAASAAASFWASMMNHTPSP